MSAWQRELTQLNGTCHAPQLRFFRPPLKVAGLGSNKERSGGKRTIGSRRRVPIMDCMILDGRLADHCSPPPPPSNNKIGMHNDARRLSLKIKWLNRHDSALSAPNVPPHAICKRGVILRYFAIQTASGRRRAPYDPAPPTVRGITAPPPPLPVAHQSSPGHGYAPRATTQSVNPPLAPALPHQSGQRTSPAPQTALPLAGWQRSHRR